MHYYKLRRAEEGLDPAENSEGVASFWGRLGDMICPITVTVDSEAQELQRLCLTTRLTTEYNWGIPC